MSPFTVLVLFIEACLMQSAFGQSGCGGSCGLSLGRVSQPAISVSQASLGSGGAYGSYSSSGYGGQGIGKVAVEGGIDATGNTVVTGSVPVLGSVKFCGTVPASGSVSISGQCGCSCV